MSSVNVGFHVEVRGKREDCERPLYWHDSPSLSWSECACGASSLYGMIVTYGAPLVANGQAGRRR